LKIAPTVPAADDGVEAKIAILKRRGQNRVNGLYRIVQPIVPMAKAGKLSFQYVSGESVNGSIAEAAIRRAPPTRRMYLWSK